MDTEGKVLFLTTTFPDGRKAFYFMLVSRQNRAALFDALNADNRVELSKYGKIVRYNWGEASENDKAFMREKYRVKI